MQVRQEALNLKALFGIVSSVHLDAMIAIFLHRIGVCCHGCHVQDQRAGSCCGWARICHLAPGRRRWCAISSWCVRCDKEDELWKKLVTDNGACSGGVLTGKLRSNEAAQGHVTCHIKTTRQRTYSHVIIPEPGT